MPETADELVEEYRSIYGERVPPEKYSHMKEWLEKTQGKRMPRPFFYTGGSGGGQKYRIWYFISSKWENADKPACYYVVPSMKTASNRLQKSKHQSLQEWLDDTNPNLKF